MSKTWGPNEPKVTATMIAEIRRLYKNGVPRKLIAERFKLSGSTLWHILRGYGNQDSTKNEAYRAAIDALHQIRKYINLGVIQDATNDRMIEHLFNIAEIVNDALSFDTENGEKDERG
jgi:hypothetical protein